MPKVEIPDQLKRLLDESDLQAPIRTLADRTGEILADNKLPFFPDYTDHGIEHINSVLKSEVGLVPKEIWESSAANSDPKLLCDSDAAVIVGATLLHDIAMHLRPHGFRELIDERSRFQPLCWFSDNHEGHIADLPWHILWDDYVREVRRFSDHQLTNIIGEESAQVWRFCELPDDEGRWEKNHYLIIGEFLRRHHARLAHEIAIYGFPGIPVGSGQNQFPAMGKEEGHPLMRLAELIGLTARSHGTSLRVCKAFLDSSTLYPGTPRPMGTAVLFPMALLRVADYFQIDGQRAPAVLLQLRNPQSPTSVLEWKKHRAVQNIGPATDPRGKLVTVSTKLSLTLYLQLRELLDGLQSEMDHSTAVLDEVYGTQIELGLNRLNLAVRRVYSNLQSPAFRNSLPYVPERTGFSADPKLLALLVEPLYGKEPSVGVRELIQNAVDAVVELNAWCTARNKPAETLNLPDQGADVRIDFVRREDRSWFVRVRDKGVGMKSETLQNYFFRAGASFRHSPEWAKEFLDDKGNPTVARAGRFGIGAFAVFLLGPSFKLWTRYVGTDKSMGYAIEASSHSQLIEIRRVDDLPIGTTIEAELSDESVRALDLEREEYSKYKGPQKRVDWFCWNWPKVEQRVLRGGELTIMEQEFSAPIHRSEPPPEWSVIRPAGFDAVYWTFGNLPSISCNGIRICSPRTFLADARYEWPVEDIGLLPPNIAIVDSGARLPLTTQRYALSQRTVPFLDELVRDVTISFIAHALVCGPRSRIEALSFDQGHPLRVDQSCEFGTNTSGIRDSEKTPFAYGRQRWCATSHAFVPSDPWLYTLLGCESCLVAGALEIDKNHRVFPRTGFSIVDRVAPTDGSVLSWHGVLSFLGGSRTDRLTKAATEPALILSTLAKHGVASLGHELIASHVLVSVSREMKFAIGEFREAGVPSRRKVAESAIWRKDDSNVNRTYIEAQVGPWDGAGIVSSLLREIEAGLPSDAESPGRFRHERNPELLFVAWLSTKRVERSPESMIAKVWSEFVGAHAIPFDTRSRESLIAEVSKQPEMRRHIEAWRKIGRRINVVDEDEKAEVE